MSKDYKFLILIEVFFCGEGFGRWKIKFVFFVGCDGDYVEFIFGVVEVNIFNNNVNRWVVIFVILNR